MKHCKCSTEWQVASVEEVPEICDKYEVDARSDDEGQEPCENCFHDEACHVDSNEAPVFINLTESPLKLGDTVFPIAIVYLPASCTIEYQPDVYFTRVAGVPILIEKFTGVEMPPRYAFKTSRIFIVPQMVLQALRGLDMDHQNVVAPVYNLNENLSEEFVPIVGFKG